MTTRLMTVNEEQRYKAAISILSLKALAREAYDLMRQTRGQEGYTLDSYKLLLVLGDFRRRGQERLYDLVKQAAHEDNEYSAARAVLELDGVLVATGSAI